MKSGFFFSLSLRLLLLVLLIKVCDAAPVEETKLKGADNNESSAKQGGRNQDEVQGEAEDKQVDPQKLIEKLAGVGDGVMSGKYSKNSTVLGLKVNNDSLTGDKSQKESPTIQTPGKPLNSIDSNNSVVNVNKEGPKAAKKIESNNEKPEAAKKVDTNNEEAKAAEKVETSKEKAEAPEKVQTNHNIDSTGQRSEIRNKKVETGRNTKAYVALPTESDNLSNQHVDTKPSGKEDQAQNEENVEVESNEQVEEIDPISDKKEKVKPEVPAGDKAKVQSVTEKILVPNGFPEVQDYHFLYYLVFLMVFGAALYIGVHNKKKILGLLIEGRRPSGTRRSGVRYRRLSQKDDNDSLSYRDTESNIVY